VYSAENFESQQAMSKPAQKCLASCPTASLQQALGLGSERAGQIEIKTAAR